MKNRKGFPQTSDAMINGWPLKQLVPTAADLYKRFSRFGYEWIRENVFAFHSVPREQEKDDERTRAIIRICDADTEEKSSWSPVTDWAWHWAHCGYPRLLVDHKYAASLMSTSVSEDAAALIRPPFESFLITMPNNLLTMPCGEYNSPGHVERILVRSFSVEGKQRWFVTIAGSDGTTGSAIHSSGRATESMACAETTRIAEELTPFPDLVDALKRLIFLVDRLILGLCLSMSDPSCFKKISSEGRSARWSPQGQLLRPPDLQSYKVGRPVVIDCQREVRDFLMGIGNKPNVRVLVRGHWKAQAHGPGRALRKYIHVEPYWRGPEDAPVLIRPHVVQSKE